jgi:peptide/nickel transport system substrate-binding protein
MSRHYGLRPLDMRGLLRQAAAGGLSRRQLLHRAAAMGLAVSAAQTVMGVSPSKAVRLQADPTTLTIGLNGSPSDIDPHSQYDYRSTLAVRGPYEGLIGLKGGTTDEYEGLIAERWEANADKSVWTFHLREGVTFQDGSPCDAEAVRASYERLLTLGKGAFNVVARFAPDPKQITAPDARTVVFDLGKPQPLFETAMAATLGVQIVNVQVARQHEEDDDWGNAWMQLNAEGTGTGPYRIVEFEPGDRVVMEQYDDYWGGWEGPHFDRIVVRVVEEAETLRQLIERGEIDIIDRFGVTYEALPELEQNPDLNVDRSTSTEVVYLTLTEAGPLAPPEARQAMCWAFPYDEVLEGFYKGYAKQGVGPVAEPVRGFAPETFAYTTDLAKAKELFAKSGVAEGTELSLMLQPGDEIIGQLYQANLAEIGISLTLEEVDTTTFTATFYGDAPAEERPHVMFWSWWPDYNDAWNQLYPIVSCESWGSKGGNGGFYCNERVDELLAQAKDAPDLEVYTTALAEAQQILSQDDPSGIYFAQPEWDTVLRKGVEGFVFNPINLGTYDLHALHRAE